ncbi:putative uncharacterized protein DDB_G0271606 [Daphnia pulicaria]|uniref:putative uncharacterized protein DDB_G0271606 n=1 Tax=Daphnia pulicaria TaxID=35523 RepID=UPI001EEA1C8B|nr:putative uncharacterized protein DDB_G0271606 [Daphnia pulicaria]
MIENRETSLVFSYIFGVNVSCTDQFLEIRFLGCFKMMNNSKSKHFNGNDPSKSKPHGKRNKTKKSSKKKNADSDNQGSSSKEQDDAVLSSSNEDTVETVYAESNHVPLVIPKWEKPDTQRKAFHLARDPRMTSNPIMERDDEMDEDISNEAFPPDWTNNELVHTAELLQSPLQSIIDINVENVKNEKDDLGLGENNDWKTRFWSEADTTTEASTTVPVVRIKSEPMDKTDFNSSSEPIEDDRCFIDSGSIVGLPSPGRASPPASPTISIKNGEENQTAGGISDDNETPRISPEQRLISSERKDDADVTPVSGIQSGMTVQHLPPQQPAQPVAAQIPVIAQQNLIPVQASSSRNSGAPVPTLIQPSTSVLTQSNLMHPVVLLLPSAPLQQQSQPTPVVPIHDPQPLVSIRGLIPQHPHTLQYLIKDLGRRGFHGRFRSRSSSRSRSRSRSRRRSRSRSRSRSKTASEVAPQQQQSELQQQQHELQQQRQKLHQQRQNMQQQRQELKQQRQKVHQQRQKLHQQRQKLQQQRQELQQQQQKLQQQQQQKLKQELQQQRQKLHQQQQQKLQQELQQQQQQLQQQQQHSIPATPTPASPIVPRVDVAESAAMSALKAIAAAYARANEEEEENLEILFPHDEPTNM